MRAHHRTTTPHGFRSRRTRSCGVRGERRGGLTATARRRVNVKNKRRLRLRERAPRNNDGSADELATRRTILANQRTFIGVFHRVLAFAVRRDVIKLFPGIGLYGWGAVNARFMVLFIYGFGNYLFTNEPLRGV